MRYIDYGLSILTEAALSAWPAGQPFDLAAVYAQLAESGQLAGLEVHRRFYEIGSPQGLQETDAYLRQQLGRRAR
jgi:NDP-sugar pyrophosphorylase family protein